MRGLFFCGYTKCPRVKTWLHQAVEGGFDGGMFGVKSHLGLKNKPRLSVGKTTSKVSAYRLCVSTTVKVGLDRLCVSRTYTVSTERPYVSTAHTVSTHRLHVSRIEKVVIHRL